MALSLLFLFLLLASSAPIVRAGPAASCAGGATDPCCNLGNGLDLDLKLLMFSLCKPDLQTCVICGTGDSQNTADASSNQNGVWYWTNRFAVNSCFGGYIAPSPGSGATQLPSLHDYYFGDIQQSACSINCTETAIISHNSLSQCSGAESNSMANFHFVLFIAIISALFTAVYH